MKRKEYPTADELAAVLGTRNWFVARRSRRMIDKYGEDVLCLSQDRFREAQATAMMNRKG